MNTSVDAYELSEVMESHREGGELYHEFLRSPSLSAGLYVLPAGAADPQQPHTEDEVYYVVSGAGMIRVDDENRPISEGSIIYVDRGVEHRFHSITRDLTVLVVFAPPRRSLAGSD